MSYLIIFIQIFFVPIMAPMVVGFIRKCKAKMQNRRGPSIFQPYKDIIKLFRKDEALSHDASWVFSFAPYVVFGVTLLIGAIIPVLITNNVLSSLGDYIVLISLVALGTFLLALGGLDTGNAFGDIGSSREMTLAALTEGSLMFSFLPVMIIAGSTNLTLMLAHSLDASGGSMVALIISGLAFFIALLAENSRYPFDNPSTHLELTMVHEAMIIEYSGKRLALMEWASANKLMIFLVLCVNIFLPWGTALPTSIGSLLAALGFVLFKVFVLAAIIAVLESATPKLRYFRLPELLFTSYALGIAALLIAIM